uniref:FAD-binding FR-type domain-containing protein n=1 Tax=Ditylum brightwellii TaxID=49249 RepID=A0A7S4UUI0_9STRA
MKKIILFQMSLIPFTMSRLSIANASSMALNNLIPFNRMIQFHIHLGYTMIGIIFFATIIFFTFFGLLCSNGDQSFCDKFTSEIMITGYVILCLLMIVGATSFFRDVVPYEIFFKLHHLVFVMYAVAIAHTFDDVHRLNERVRSQNFKWFAAPLLYYFCDRAAMHINHRYQTKVATITAVTSSDRIGKGARLAIVKLHRPSLFMFEPGQYALLKIPGIDANWHPFSIASGPESDYLEFYIEVHGNESWTNRLWCMINGSSFSGHKMIKRYRGITVEVKGPYGTPLGQTEDFSHSIAIGSGTGIVPIISLFKKHIHSLVRLDPEIFFSEQKVRNRKIQDVYSTYEKNKGSIFSSFLHSCAKCRDLIKSQIFWQSLPEPRIKRQQRRQSISQSIKILNEINDSTKFRTNLTGIKRASMKARLPIYGSALLLILPILGVMMLGLTFSINTIANPNFNGIEIIVYDWQVVILKSGTIIFQTLFLVVSTTVHNRAHFFTCVDVVIAIISFFVDWYWFVEDLWGKFGSSELTHFSLIIFYMTLRSWNTAVKASDKSWRKDVSRDGIFAMDKLSFIWVTRSAHLVSKILPDIVDLWDVLCRQWGENYARQVCGISIYVTDTDKKACSILSMEMKKTSLYRDSAIKFQRPDFPKIIEEHTMERVEDCRNPHSNTLLAFCGSPNLSSVVSEAKIINDLSKFITGNRLHQMQFVSESYGTSKTENKKQHAVKDNDRFLSSRSLEVYDFTTLTEA